MHVYLCTFSKSRSFCNAHSALEVFENFLSYPVRKISGAFDESMKFTSSLFSNIKFQEKLLKSKKLTSCSELLHSI